MQFIDPKWLEIFKQMQLFWIFLLLLIHVIHIFTTTFSQVEPIGFYYLILIFSLGIPYVILNLQKLKNQKIAIEIRFFPHCVLLGLVFMIVVASRFYFNDLYPLWLDELNQNFFFPRYPTELPNAISISFAQQQPPTGYIFSQLSTKFFGYNEFGMRWYVYLLGGLFAVYLFALTKVFRFNTPYGLITTFFLTFSNSVFQYGIESRPGISLALVFSTFVIYESINTLHEAENRKMNMFSLMTVSVFFLLSVGMQPPLFLGALVLTLLTAKLSARINVFYVVTSVGIAGVMFLPIQLHLVKSSSFYLKDVSVSSLSDVFAASFKTMLWRFYSPGYAPLTTLWTSLIIVFVFCLVIIGKRMSGRRHRFFPEALLQEVSLFGYFLFFYFLIIFTIQGLFSFYINWSLAERYNILALVPLTLGLALLFRYFADSIGGLALQKSKSTIRFSVFFLLFSGAYFVLFYPPLRVNRFKERAESFHFTNSFLPDIKKNDALIPACFHWTKRGCLTHLESTKFVEDSTAVPLPESATHPVFSVLKRLQEGQDIDRIFLFLSTPFPAKILVAPLGKYIHKIDTNNIVFVLSGKNKWDDYVTVVGFVNRQTVDQNLDQRRNLDLANLVAKMKTTPGPYVVDGRPRTFYQWETIEYQQALSLRSDIIYSKDYK